MGNKKKGQIVVLVLLLSLMGLTIGLSQVSRSLSDLKQVTYVDAGTKAFAGAEAGLQYALSQLTAGATGDCGTENDITTALSLGQNFSSVKYKICPNPTSYAYFPAVSSDESREIDPTLASSALAKIDVAWNNAANLNSNLEVIVVNNNYTMIRYVYNAFGTSPATGFGPSYVVSNCTNVITSGSCTGPNSSGSIPVSNNYKLVRVKPLSNSSGATDIVIVGHNNGGAVVSLGATTYTVTATATTTNNTAKKLQIIKTPSSLPGIFDHAIFSRGSVIKS